MNEVVIVKEANWCNKIKVHYSLEISYCVEKPLKCVIIYVENFVNSNDVLHVR